jgi:hypothetical protein
MEYYSASKRKENLTLAPTWVDLEDTMLSEISQSDKDKCYLVALVFGP